MAVQLGMSFSIGVIYRESTMGTGTPTFQDTDEEFAVIRGDLQRLNYTKTV